jgi:hypothetical protein
MEEQICSSWLDVLHVHVLPVKGAQAVLYATTV